ncbi:MAG: hypothetical protein FWH18_07235 [Marinilabiliaceae bacterium]|nr:hypothetical protein [Marinilabiliaceae bacterium]
MKKVENGKTGSVFQTREAINAGLNEDLLSAQELENTEGGFCGLGCLWNCLNGVNGGGGGTTPPGGPK